jgi:hypothetical protein
MSCGKNVWFDLSLKDDNFLECFDRQNMQIKIARDEKKSGFYIQEVKYIVINLSCNISVKIMESKATR